MSSFDPLAFLNLLKDRTLVIGQDSISRELFYYILCSSYQPGMKLAYSEGKRGSHIFKFTDYNVTMIMFDPWDSQRYNISSAAVEFLLAPKDILIFNIGLRLHKTQILNQYENQIVKDFLSLPALRRPTFIWRETTTQHFKTEDGYFYENDDMLKPCAPIQKNEAQQIQDDYRNRMFEQVAEKEKKNRHISDIGIPIMRVGHLFTEFDSHMSFVKAHRPFNMESEFIYDCTHYCVLSGILSFMREYVYNIVQAVVKEKVII